MTPPIIFGITGASGAPYAVRLLQQLAAAKRPVSLIISSHGFRLLDTEMAIGSIQSLRLAVGKKPWDTYVKTYANEDRGAPPASGSALSAGMVVCPCSMGTLSAISVGASRSLIERAADVILKERRKLILVPRETPLNAIHLQNMLRLSRAGAVVLPAAPAFYHKPATIDDMIDFIVARVLDQLGVEHKLGKRWDGSHAM
ncbi:MAG TPA: flavin prenyltransferase UbiX [Gemmatimonadaceae bacterium]|nr:flavin prenyltransferase UbiX [Gemmatimonadaceae bacterium]